MARSASIGGFAEPAADATIAAMMAIEPRRLSRVERNVEPSTTSLATNGDSAFPATRSHCQATKAMAPALETSLP